MIAATIIILYCYENYRVLERVSDRQPGGRWGLQYGRQGLTIRAVGLTIRAVGAYKTGGGALFSKNKATKKGWRC